MLPARSRLDPDGYYHRLDLEPSASRTAIVSAFRAKARILHPDVPNTGNAGAFVAMKQAYDVLSNADRRAAYDRAAREGMVRPDGVVPPRPAAPGARQSPNRPPPNRPPPNRPPRPIEIPVVIWVGLGAFLCLCVYQVVVHLMALPPLPNAGIRPNAATVAPLSPSAHEAILYGPTPVRLAGTPNFYVVPAASPAVLWRLDADRNVLVPLAQLPPFSSVEAVRLVRQVSMLEVLVNEHGNGFISADHLAPGNAAAARQAYCSYNAGPTPTDGELLERQGSGSGTLEVENRAVQPVVVKLRDERDAVALAVFLAPGGNTVVDGLPDGIYHAEFAIGELWSRACGVFAAGMRARRLEGGLRVPSDSPLVVAPDATQPEAADIPDQEFGRR
jgi:hypothetical protein